MREERQSSTAVLWKHLATESWHQETNLQTNMIKRETHIWNSLVLSLTQLFILVTIKTKQQVFISTTAYADFTQHSQILHACQTDTHTLSAVSAVHIEHEAIYCLLYSVYIFKEDCRTLICTPPKERYPILQTCYITLQQALKAEGKVKASTTLINMFCHIVLSSHTHTKNAKMCGWCTLQKQLVESVHMCVCERERAREGKRDSSKGERVS